MGWTCFQGMPRGGMQAAVVESLTWESEGVETRVLKAEMVGDNVYAAVEEKRDGSVKVRGVVGIIEGCAYKLIVEECGPYYWDCPADILAMLSPTDEPLALAWRKKCAGVMQ